MSFFRKIALGSLLAPLVLSLACLSTPADAKASSSGKKDDITSVQEKKKSDKKKASKKSKSSKKRKGKEKSKVSNKVTIDASDPKAFTKALLLEKKGIDFEVVGEKQQTQLKIVPPKNEDKSHLDFSKMLIPITHEALIGSKYGIRDHRLHRGVDVNVIKDEPVVAALPGKVIMSKYNSGGYGHYVLIEHDHGIQTLYGHLSERLLKIGDYVYPGDIVGLAGNTGKSSAAHLHFEIRYGDINIDPETIVDFPKWELKKGVDRVSKKKILNAHYNMQRKLQKENAYIVKKGDSQGDVAKWFNISIPALCRLNNLKQGAPLKVGQKLIGSK